MLEEMKSKRSSENLSLTPNEDRRGAVSKVDDNDLVILEAAPRHEITNKNSSQVSLVAGVNL